jgi:hypothetical protein
LEKAEFEEWRQGQPSWAVFNGFHKRIETCLIGNPSVRQMRGVGGHWDQGNRESDEINWVAMGAEGRGQYEDCTEVRELCFHLLKTILLDRNQLKWVSIIMSVSAWISHTNNEFESLQGRCAEKAVFWTSRSQIRKIITVNKYNLMKLWARTVDESLTSAVGESNCQIRLASMRKSESTAVLPDQVCNINAECSSALDRCRQGNERYESTWLRYPMSAILECTAWQVWMEIRR